MFTQTVQELIQSRLDTMTEKDLKDVGKDEVTIMLNHMRDFLMLSITRLEAAEFVEKMQLQFALRFMKSENLEKRLKGLSEIRNLIDRAIERLRFERYRQKTGKNLNYWNSMQENKEKPYPSDSIRVADIKQWMVDN